jgi:hypothetical protein
MSSPWLFESGHKTENGNLNAETLTTFNIEHGWIPAMAHGIALHQVHFTAAWTHNAAWGKPSAGICTRDFHVQSGFEAPGR